MAREYLQNTAKTRLGTVGEKGGTSGGESKTVIDEGEKRAFLSKAGKGKLKNVAKAKSNQKV